MAVHWIFFYILFNHWFDKCYFDDDVYVYIYIIKNTQTNEETIASRNDLFTTVLNAKTFPCHKISPRAIIINATGKSTRSKTLRREIRSLITAIDSLNYLNLDSIQTKSKDEGVSLILKASTGWKRARGKKSSHRPGKNPISVIDEGNGKKRE